MTIPEFIKPSWLNDQDAETIHKRMMDALPVDIDDTEGGFPWDFTKPTALEKAEMLEFHLVETLKIMHPMWAYGKWLNYHAWGVGVNRKSPNSAYGVLHITGLPGTEIPAGFMFAVAAVGSKPAVEFIAFKGASIGEDGTATVEVIAAVPGIGGNVAADTIKLMSTPIKGITSISNPERTTGGTGEEDDDSLRERVMEINEAAEASFVGCDSDYIRWAKEISGVSDAFVVPQWDQEVPNSVKVVVMGADGELANDKTIADVYNHIISPDDRIKRKAPIGAIVTVAAPEPCDIDYTFVVELAPDYKLSAVLDEFTNNIQKYYAVARKEGVVRYTQAHAVLAKTVGIQDFTGLTMNGKTENVRLAADEYPVTKSIDPGITESEVE